MTLDETEGNQDKTSEDPKGTSEQTPQTLTEEERTKKAVSDALSAAGRDAKTLDIREGKVKEALTKAEKLQADIKADAEKRAEQKYQEDLANAGDDTLARSKVELNRDLRLAREELDNTKTKLGKRDEELTDARKVAAESTKERNAREIASKYEVDSKTLLLTDGSVEAMEALAKTLSGKTATTLKPDSGKTIGGGLSDEAFIKRLGEGGESLTKEDLARAKKLGIIR